MLPGFVVLAWVLETADAAVHPDSIGYAISITRMRTNGNDRRMWNETPTVSEATFEITFFMPVRAGCMCTAPAHAGELRYLTGI
jgi:hypothetical protein